MNKSTNIITTSTYHKHDQLCLRERMFMNQSLTTDHLDNWQPQKES